jgi:hypothetical protein
MRGGVLGSRPRDSGDAEHHAHAARDGTRSDSLVEDARREHQEKHDAERDDRLNESQRRKRERQQLEGPSNDCQPNCREPKWTPREPGKERNLDRPGDRDAPGLDRLHHVRGLVAGGRGRGGKSAKRNIDRHR